MEPIAVDTVGRAQSVHNRVLKVTVDFWLITRMAVAVDETVADLMNFDLGLGPSTTSRILSGSLIAALALQFTQQKYGP